MSRSACFLGAVIFCGGQAAMWAQDEAPPKLPDGVYAVQRDSLKEKDVLPLKDGEVLAVHHHRYLKSDAKEPPRFLVVRPRPDVTLDLAGAPTVVKDGDEVVRILTDGTAGSGFFGVTLRRARSVLVSLPRTFSTLSLVPSLKFTMISSAPSMT